MMQPYEFTLVFALPSAVTDFSDYEDRLFEAGCDDALLGIGHPRRLGLDLMRHADDARTAVFSAIDDVRRAVPDAVLVEVQPDLVGMSDVAELVGRSRQNIRKLLLSTTERVPVPVHSGSPTLWNLAPVLAWLRDEKGYRIDHRLLEVAEVAMLVNAQSANARVRSQPRIVRELEALLAPV